MYALYSLLLSIGFILMMPMFLLRREKYASGFKQRLGEYSHFEHDERRVIWLHCVSVGETNAARPLVEKLIDSFPDHRLVISTTTRTGHELARKVFADTADAIVYFPFDWKFSVRRALSTFKPSLVLLMETEIWPRFVHETKRIGANIAIVNGRLSERSFARYRKIRSFLRTVLAEIDLAMMQTDADAKRIIELGMDAEKVAVTGNLKFEQTASDTTLTEELRSRFAISSEKPLIIAASTHEPEERYIIEGLDGELGVSCRLMIVPRHPERFDSVANLLRETKYAFVRRSSPSSDEDKSADIVLLDSIGELRAAYPLADIVFVGGSLIPHGGQSVLEPAAEGKAIVTGPFTSNFDAVVKKFLASEAIIQFEEDDDPTAKLSDVLIGLLDNAARRISLGQRAAIVMDAARGATDMTIEGLKKLTLEEKDS